MTKFWLMIFVLLLIHTIVCFGADRAFATRYVAPQGAAPVETTTPEQQANGERVFVFVTHSIERPFALLFYAIGGYVSLLAAAAGAYSLFCGAAQHDNALIHQAGHDPQMSGL